MRFVLLDKLLSIESGRRAVASKRFGADEEFFLDHFPGHAIVPGVLLIECMAQTGGWLIGHSTGFTNKLVLALVERAKFRAPALPDQELRVEAELDSVQARTAAIDGAVSVDGKVIASARIVYALHDLSVEGPFANPAGRHHTQSVFARLDGPAAAARGSS